MCTQAQEETAVSPGRMQEASAIPHVFGKL